MRTAVFGRGVLVTPLAMLAAGLSVSAAEGPRIRIARFSGDRDAAITFTFDDGFRFQAKRHLAALEPHGFRGTFFIVVGATRDTDREGGNRLSWQRLREMAAAGHEIGNHSWSHPALRGDLGEEAIRREIDHAYEVMEKKMGAPPFTFCYPGGSKPEEVREFVYRKHRAAREKQLFYGGMGFTLGKANAWVDEAIENGEWIVAMIHAISQGYAAFDSPEIFDDHLEHVKEREGRIWVDTFGAVSRYVQERDAAKLVITKLSRREARFRLTCDPDPKVFDHPLTVVIPVRGAKRAKASCGGRKIPVVVAKDKLLVYTVPCEKVVRVTW
jgi:peptidoglycan/xylan/chitin deacetylase (PgdA/CDA1 family)